MLIRRDCLRCELTTEPRALLDEHDGTPQPKCGDGGSDTAYTSADDEDIGMLCGHIALRLV